MNWLKEAGKRFENISAIVSCVIQVGGISAFSCKLVEDPLQASIIVGVGMLGYWATAIYVFSKKTTPSSSLILPGSTTVKAQPHYSLKVRRIFLIGGLVITTLSTWFLVKNLVLPQVDASSGSPLPSGSQSTSYDRDQQFGSPFRSDIQLVDYEEYQVTPPALSLATVPKSGWIFGGAKAIMSDGNIVPLAAISGPSDVFAGKDCVLNVRIAARSNAGKVVLDSIRVTVLDYKPVPKYKAVLPAVINKSTNFYVAIDALDGAVSKSFDATMFVEGDVKTRKLDRYWNFGISPDNPEPIVVHVDAKRPGLYKFKIDCLLSNTSNKQAIEVATPQTWLFDKMQKITQQTK